MQALADTNSFVQTTAAKALKKIEVSQAASLR
jgi:hypothetical protein